MQQRDAPAFSILLRRHRVAAGLTQEELAERALISVRTISDAERGIARRPQMHTMRQLADGLALEGESRRQFLDSARGPTHAAAEDVGENGPSRILPMANEQSADGQPARVLLPGTWGIGRPAEEMS